MKKLIATEITEADLQHLIEESIRKVLYQELQKLNISTVASPSSETYLSRKEIIELIGLSYPTVIKLTRNGILKGKRVGRVYRYKKSDVQRYFSQQ
jgi:excisionase family DNA binding protein